MSTHDERGPEPRRHALAHQGGAVDVRGDEEASALLAEALLSAGEENADTLTHGFHAYPARMHAAIAHALIPALSPEGGRVLDPFCGSGTVLVEALVAGRRAAGVDLNPLALRIAEVKCDLRDAGSRDRFAATLEGIAERSEERVRGRVDARAPLSRDEAKWYAPHILKELAGLREELLAIDDERDRRAFEVVLSSIVVKCSKQRADTASREHSAPRTLRKGLPTEWFLAKGRELVERWAAFDAAAPEAPRRAPLLIEGDARKLGALLNHRAADLILSSPPYGGTYDYVDHHARRYPWLGLRTGRFRKGELGARRDLSGEGVGGERRDPAALWDAQVNGMLKSMRKVTRPGSHIVLLVGDAQLGQDGRGVRIDAARQLEQLAPSHRLRFVAAASQRRPDWTGRRERREHLVMLAPMMRG